MWYLINSWKLLSENPQALPPLKKSTHSNWPFLLTPPPPKKKKKPSKSASPPPFLQTLKIFQPPSFRKGGGHYASHNHQKLVKTTNRPQPPKINQNCPQQLKTTHNQQHSFRILSEAILHLCWNIKLLPKTTNKVKCIPNFKAY